MACTRMVLPSNRSPDFSATSRSLCAAGSTYASVVRLSNSESAASTSLAAPAVRRSFVTVGSGRHRTPSTTPRRRAAGWNPPRSPCFVLGEKCHHLSLDGLVGGRRVNGQIHEADLLGELQRHHGADAVVRRVGAVGHGDLVADAVAADQVVDVARLDDTL